MLPPRLPPQAGPAAWNAAALSLADWMIPVGAELGGELAGTDAARPRLELVMGQVAERLEQGRGFVLLRGLPLERLAEGAGVEAAALVMGGRLGTLLSQDLAGILAVRVTAEAPDGLFHAEPADAVALLCLQQPVEGRGLALTSAAALHNALLKSDRAALAVLHQPFPHRAAAPGGRIDMPVFSLTSGSFVGRYDRAAMPEAELTPEQLAALAALDAAAAQPGQAVEVPLRAGDMLFYNPHLVWRHAGGAPVPGRELLRLWLTTPGSRALPDSFRAVFRETAAGAPRGGATTEPGPEMVGG